ncbi:MAG: TM1812 family CRISPR-associated protein [Ruminococcus sp.]|nr:TM1812 family CRISPR-associated protein [Ruminococcus sp.]MDE6784697.1 TM1812 family CRISPR-associated protein [Ruminococcus sp.]
MADVILTNLSSLRKPRPGEELKEYIFKSDIGDINGIQTNDAPVKYLISYLNCKGRKAAKIIAVATSEADEAYKSFCQMLSDYEKETGINIPVPVKTYTSESKIAETIQDIVNETSINDNIYIDTTGGFRNSSYLLMGVVRVLEYSNRILEKAVYSKFIREKTEENVIEDVTGLYNMFDLINAVNTFTSIGNSHELEEYFCNCDNEIIQKTIKTMNVFSDEITLCRTSKLNNVLQQLNNCLSELSELKSNSRDIILFKSLSETIRSKFNVQNGDIEYPAIVKWCLDSRLIQQAVTVFVEKMPDYFYQKKYFTVTDSQLEEVRKKNEKSTFGLYYELFYTNLMQDNCWSKSVIMLLKRLVEKVDIKTVRNSYQKARTDEEIIFNALLECRDSATFLSRLSGKDFKKYGLESMRSDLNHFFRVRNAIYKNDTLNDLELINKNLEKNYPDVYEILNSDYFKLPNNPKQIKLPSNSKQFINFLMNPNPNHVKLVETIFGIKREYKDSHLMFIENISKNNVFSDYTLTDKLSCEELQKLFRDIYYAKTFIRNKLNHASESDSDDEELRSYFAKYNYKIDNELDVEDISRLLYQSIENLKL